MVNIIVVQVRELAKFSEKTSINNLPWANGKVNKTLKYMSETGIKGKTVRKVVRELKLENFCYTEDDRNPNFPGEKVWIFGICKNLVDHEEDFYIKLKIRNINGEKLSIMSFHPEEYTEQKDKLNFPYRKQV